MSNEEKKLWWENYKPLTREHRSPPYNPDIDEVDLWENYKFHINKNPELYASDPPNCEISEEK